MKIGIISDVHSNILALEETFKRFEKENLTNMLDDNQIVKVLNDNSTINEKLEKLVFKANNRGGNDNISIAYLKKESGDL